MPYKDPAAKKAYLAKYYQAHREELSEYKAKWYKEHLEVANEHHAKWYKEHLEQFRAYHAKYYQQNPIKGRAVEATRRALKRDASVGPVDYAVIMERDKMVCGICHKKVKLAKMHIDHIIPLSKGGPHAEHNLQVSHAACNLRKNNTGRLPSQTRLPF